LVGVDLAGVESAHHQDHHPHHVSIQGAHKRDVTITRDLTYFVTFEISADFLIFSIPSFIQEENVLKPGILFFLSSINYFKLVKN